MKILSIAAVLGLLTCHILADDDTLLIDESITHPDLSKPSHVRIQVRLFEVSLTDLSNINRMPLLVKPNMYDAVQKLQKQGKAKLIHLTVMTARSGEKATSESIREMIYPTEYDIDRGPYNPTADDPIFDLTAKSFFLRPYGVPPVAFETRNVGDTLEIEPTIGENGTTVDLRLGYERARHLGNTTWLTHKDEWGDANLFLPHFGSHRPTTALTLINGKMELIAALTPHKKAKSDSEEKRILVFVKATVVQP